MRSLILGFILLVFLGGATVFAKNRIGAPGDAGLGATTLRCTFGNAKKRLLRLFSLKTETIISLFLRMF